LGRGGIATRRRAVVKATGAKSPIIADEPMAELLGVVSEPIMSRDAGLRAAA